MPKYTPTQQRLAVRAAVNMATFAATEATLKLHINEMIDDLRKEYQATQIVTNGVIIYTVRDVA